MSKKQQEQDAAAQVAGGIGGLAIVTGILAAIKEKTGLPWGATVALVAGLLIALGYGAWKFRTAIGRFRAGFTGSAAALKPEPLAAQQDTVVEEVPRHPELTEALITAGVIDKAEVIRLDEVTVKPVSTGKQYTFLLPKTRTYKDVEARVANVAGWFGKSRLHVKLERSRDNEREVNLLLLDNPPFAQPFDPPSRQEISAFKGVPLGHDVTGQLVGVPTFDKASMLVGGMTQMGKTTLINGLVTCLLIAYGDFDLYLLDGKLCGLIKFENVCVRYEASDQPDVFESMVDELNERVERRYRKKQAALRNRQSAPNFKPVFFIVDEAADFFADDGTPKGKERAARITEKARKLVARALESGISSIMLTQRPENSAIPVIVRNQFLIRLCMYVESEGTTKVTLGDSYFGTVAPINPTHLNPNIKGQGVLFEGGRSTLVRGFDFPDQFMWEIVDEVEARQRKSIAAAPESPLTQAIELLRSKGVDFMPTAVLAPAIGISDTRPGPMGTALAKKLGAKPGKDPDGTRGYWLADLIAAAKAGVRPVQDPAELAAGAAAE